jgi:cytochrome c oxidase subunit IV
MENSQSTKAGKPTGTYAVVFVVLAAITAVELLITNSSVALAQSLLNTLFVIFSLAKAALVAGFYMHLRGDNRFYTFVFLLPVALFLAFALLMIIR